MIRLPLLFAVSTLTGSSFALAPLSATFPVDQQMSARVWLLGASTEAGKKGCGWGEV